MTEYSDIKTIAAGIGFAEGPRWHDDKFWFSDFYQHSVSTIDRQGNLEKIVEVPEHPSGLGWRPDGTMLIVSMRNRQLLSFTDQGLTTVADLSGVASSYCNDMVVDRQGRAYVGNFGFNRHQGEEPKNADLALVNLDGDVSVAATDLAFPNGAVITDDGKRFILAETMGKRLTAFDIEADGHLANRRVFAEFDDAYPDGICLDAEGAIWVADAGGNSVLRVFEGGRIAGQVDLGERHSYACMLGGDDRQTLYICSNIGSGPEIGKQNQGQIDTVRVDVPGAGLP